MKKHLVLLVCALLCAGLLSGCWQVEPLDEDTELLQPSDAPEEDAEQSLLPEQLALPYAPDRSLDPVTCPDGMQQVVASLLCEGMFRLGPDFEPQSWLCASYTVNEDFTSYTFLLREGVTFSDGSPLTAADVRATLDRARTSRMVRARSTDWMVSGLRFCSFISRPPLEGHFTLFYDYTGRREKKQDKC